MDVLLINPPAQFTIPDNNAAIVREHRGFNPPLGLMYVAAYLRENTRHTPRIIDCPAQRIGYERLGARIASSPPDIIGITALTFTLVDVLETIRTARAAAPGATIVLGGPHVHLYPEETVNLPGVDYLVQGEGERPFAALVEAIDEDRSPDDIPGIVRKDANRVINNAMGELLDDLDAIPFPARDLTDTDLYSSVLAGSSRVTTMITSRGCPYRCTFCERSHLGKKFRARSADNVIEEISQCVDMGICEVMFYDDTFNVDRDRVMSICEGILSRGLSVQWDFRGRVDCLDIDMLRTARRAGCRRVSLGVESGTEHHLEALHKGFDLATVREGFRMARDAGIETLAYFIIGLPDETREDIQRTIDFARELDPDFAHISVLTPFPGTPIYRRGLADGIIEHDYWRHFAADPRPDFIPPYWPGELSAEELNRLRTSACKRFYLRPSYVLRQALKTRSPTELLRKARAGLGVLRMR